MERSCSNGKRKIRGRTAKKRRIPLKKIPWSDSAVKSLIPRLGSKFRDPAGKLWALHIRLVFDSRVDTHMVYIKYLRKFLTGL